MVLTLTGKNAFGVDEQKRNLIDAHLSKYGSFAIEQFSGDTEDLRSVHSALTNIPFLVEKTLVVLNRPSENKDLVSKLPTWLEQKNETTDVLIIEPTLDRRSTWAKFLRDKTDFKELQPLKDNMLESWVTERAKQYRVGLSIEARRTLIRYCSGNQLRINSELIKLADHKSEISSADVEELVEPSTEETVFNLLDKLFAGKSADAFSILKRLELNGTDPHEVISMIGWQLATLAQIVVRAKASPAEIATASSLHPYVVQKNLSIARRLSRSTLLEMINMTVEAELRIKKDGEKSNRVLQLLMAQIIDEVKRI